MRRGPPRARGTAGRRPPPREGPGARVKASISPTEAPDALARDRAARGRFPSLGAVRRRGLDLPRERTEGEAAEVEARRLLIEARRAGRVVGPEEGRARTRALLDRKRADLGPSG